MKFESPDSRVRAYISDYYLQWLEALDYMGTPFQLNQAALEKWKSACKDVHQLHFAPDSPEDELGFGYSWSSPVHHPEQERIIKVRTEEDSAVIETENAGQIPAYYEYELKYFGNEWRIAKASPFHAPEGERLFPDAVKDNILAMVKSDVPLPDLPAGISPNCERLFEGGRAIKIMGLDTRLKVMSAGILHLPSGTIGACDFGRDVDDFLPLSRSVPPGDYPVELAVVHGYGAAARVIFQPGSKVASWLPAPTVNGGPHQAEIAYMNLTFVDAEAMMSLEKRERERLFLCSYLEPVRQGRTELHRTMHLKSKPNKNPDAVCVNASDTAGDAPCYWGLAADGSIVSLVADFQFIAENQYETIQVPWSYAQWNTAIDHPLLTQWDVKLVIGSDQNGAGFLVMGTNFASARLLDSSGSIIADSEGGPKMDTHEGSVHFIKGVLTQVQNATLEITVSTGYQN